MADFHCVAGWSAVGLRWEGVPFAVMFDALLAPRAMGIISHIRFAGADGHVAVALLEDVLAEDVLLADHLDGQPLDADHGAPLRLVSPGQYGFVNTKHLSRIDLLTAEPATCVSSASLEAGAFLRLFGYGRLVRGRVWQEERHPFLPPGLVRGLSRPLIPAMRALSVRRRPSGG